MANPSRLITQPPPPMYPVIPSYYQPQAMVPPPPPQAGPSNSGQTINQPQSFVVPLNSTGHYPVYPQPGAPYYPYSYHTPYYGAQPQPGQPAPPQSSVTPQKQDNPVSHAIVTTTSVPGVAGSNQGAWSEDESTRLKQLAEQSKKDGLSGDAAWDWIVQQWGNKRTR